MGREHLGLAEAARGLAGVGFEIGSIVTRETIRNTRGAYVGLGRAALSGGGQLLHGIMTVTDAHSRGLGRRGLEDLLTEPTREEAMSEFVLALLKTPDDHEEIAAKFGAVATAMQKVRWVSDGVRTRADEEVTSMDYISDQFLEQLRSMADEQGIDGQTSHEWISTLRLYSGTDDELKAPVPELGALDRLSAAKARESEPGTV
ncbi:MAG: hypothetical protein ABIV43_03845 [Candidatus Saccharimonadales bacterium]